MQRAAILAGALATCTLSAITLPARAQDIDCTNAMAQYELNACAGQEFEAADKDLNIQYRETVSAMREEDANLEDDMKGAEAALKKAQRAWIDYRDGHCEAVGFQVRGGTMEPMVVSGCKAELTKTRTKELKSLSESDTP